MNKPWKVALVFVAVFVAGGVTGAAIAVRMAPTFVQRRVFTDQFTSAVMRSLNENLKLTEQQAEKIRPIVAATGDELVRLRRDTSAAMDRMNSGIAKELNPEQQKAHEAFLNRMREREQRDRERAKQREAERAQGGGKPSSSEGKPVDVTPLLPAEKKP